jgi:N-acetylglucosamine-6-sulfatase
MPATVEVRLALVLLACSACDSVKTSPVRTQPSHAGSAAPSASASPSASAGSAAAAGKPHKAQPNILFVLADDQRADMLACMPKLQRLLVAGGTTFKNNFASTPLCCPGRSSVLTGKYAHNHGVLANGDIEDEDGDKSPGAIDFRDNGNESKTFAGWLKSVGYRTGYFGKYLNAYDKLLEKLPNHVPPSWDEWRAFTHAEYFDFDSIEKALGETKVTHRCYLSSGGKKGKKKERKCKKAADEVVDDGKENYSTDVLRDQTIAFIRKATAEGKPWFVHFASKAPHGPFFSPARYQPDPDEAVFTKEALERLSSCSLFDWKDRPKSYLEDDMSDKPAWLVQSKKNARTKEDRLDRVRRMQLVSTLANEDAVEAIMKVLDELGIADDTIIVYTGDNGFAWGEHWHTHKNCAYEECIRVPLVVLDPRAPAGPRTVDAFTMNVDLAPTIAGWGGAKVPEKIDGMSFAGLVDGSQAAWTRTHVLSECWGPGSEGRPDTHAAVRTAKWKYVEHYDDPKRTKIRKHGKDLEIELYDLDKDPHELDNLRRLSPEGLARTGHTQAEVDAISAELKAELEKLEKQ